LVTLTAAAAAAIAGDAAGTALNLMATARPTNRFANCFPEGLECRSNWGAGMLVVVFLVHTQLCAQKLLSFNTTIFSCKLYGPGPGSNCSNHRAMSHWLLLRHDLHSLSDLRDSWSHCCLLLLLLLLFADDIKSRIKALLAEPAIRSWSTTEP
jgi:hypothetical protein